MQGGFVIEYYVICTPTAQLAGEPGRFKEFTTCGDGITLTTSRPTYWSDALAADKEQKECLRVLGRDVYTWLDIKSMRDKTRFGKRLGTSSSMSSHHIHFEIIASKTRFASTGRKKHWQLPGTA